MILSNNNLVQNVIDYIILRAAIRMPLTSDSLDTPKFEQIASKLPER